MNPREEIEYICNAAYLRGCDSNFKTAIAAMQESESRRLAYCYIHVQENGIVSTEFEFDISMDRVATTVYGDCYSEEVVSIINDHSQDHERDRLAELVNIIKEGA